MSQNSIILIDGYAMIYRSFYAMPSSFTSPTGQKVNALYGMARFFLNLSKTFQPDHCAFVLDKGRCLKRTTIHPEYKAQRPPMPEDLRSQIPLIKRWVEALGWPILEQEGVEADDIIAGICRKYDSKYKISVVSFDKDLAQLVNSHVEMLQPGVKDHWKHIGIEEVIQKYALEPFQICDYLCMLGDNSDNIPGLPGVGEKSAAKLLNQYQTIQGIYDHLEELSPSLKTKFIENVDLLKKNHDLIILDYDLPEEFSQWMKLEKKVENKELIQELCQEFGFSSLQISYKVETSTEKEKRITSKEKNTSSLKQPSLFD